MHTQVYELKLTHDEINEIRTLTRQVSLQYDSVEANEFLYNAPTLAQNLPKSFRKKLNDFSLLEPSGLCMITGYPIDDKLIGPTPPHWKTKLLPSPTIEIDIFFFFCASLLGTPIGWSTQQGGYILHDVMPIKGHEYEQIGSGSEVPLTWHTEDAFHPYRADYLGLMCLRNFDNVETTYASIDDIQLDEVSRKILFETRFTIRPDESHLEKNRTELLRDCDATEDLLRRSYTRINQMNSSPEKIAVLFGDPKSPYVRLDPYFMDHLDEDPEAMKALNNLTAAIDEKIIGIALQPGEILFIDNFKVVHGRLPFKARYDGKDRWLRRLNIARDLRKSRDARSTAGSRIIF